MKKKILIVDDDEEICEELAEILENNGYAVQTAFDGIRASRLIEKRPYHLVLLDLKLPGLSGFQILERARQLKRHVKILVITARPGLKKAQKGTDQAQGREEQTLRLADGVIHKPFDVAWLLERIKELVG